MILGRTINSIFTRLGRKFQNFVFRKRLGKTRLGAYLIITVMGFFDLFETYSNTGEVGRFDHYVPAFMLRRWRVADTGTDRGNLFRWSKVDGTVSNKPINGVAGAVDWDVSTSDGIPSDYVRKKLFAESLEVRTAHVIKLINTSHVLDLNIFEESTLAVFMGHQITRVPAFRKSLLSFFSLGYSEGLIRFEDFGSKRALLKKVVLNEIGITYTEILNLRAPIQIAGAKSQLHSASLLIGSMIGEKIYKGNLHVLEVPLDSEDEFVISDNPVVILDVVRGDLLSFIPWWEIGKRDLMIFMPISRRKAVFYCNSKRKEGPIENTNKELVTLVNFGQYKGCSEEVYSQSQPMIQNHLNLFTPELRRMRIVQ